MHRAHYFDGVLHPPKPGTSADPKPCAGNDGTTITIEDLFFNTPTRLSSLRSSSEEYARILDVVTKYAIHNPTVAFMCKKAGSASADLSTPSGSSTTQAIRQLYGPAIFKDLLSVSIASTPKGKRKRNEDDEDDPESWKADSHFTNANYQGKKMVFLLFINRKLLAILSNNQTLYTFGIDRLVESARFKRAVEAVYSGVLPKGASPFVYLRYISFHPFCVTLN